MYKNTHKSCMEACHRYQIALNLHVWMFLSHSIIQFIYTVYKHSCIFFLLSRDNNRLSSLVKLDLCTDIILNLPPACFNWLILSLSSCQDNTEGRALSLNDKHESKHAPPQVTGARLCINSIIIQNKSSVGFKESVPTHQDQTNRNNREETDTGKRER